MVLKGERVKKEVIATGETTVFVYSSGKLVAEYSTDLDLGGNKLVIRSPIADRMF